MSRAGIGHMPLENIAGSSNGRIDASEAFHLGSSPSPAASTEKDVHLDVFFCAMMTALETRKPD
jgi:hypothetical protein